MFHRCILAFLMLAIIFGTMFGAVGCNRSRKNFYSAAAVNTYTVVFVDEFTNRDRDELRNSIAAIISALHEDSPSITYNLTLNITKLHINNHPKTSNVLVTSGPENECPELYSRLCEFLFKDGKNRKSRDWELENNNRRRNILSR